MMAHEASALSLRVVIESSSRDLVVRLADALEEADMEATGQRLGQQLAARHGFASVVTDGGVRLALKPYAELLLMEIIEIAERPALSVSMRERLVDRVMVDAGYA